MSIDVLLSRSEPSGNPQLSFMWVCKSLPFGMDPTYVESVDLPFCNIDASDGWHGAGTFTYYPGFSNISDFSLTLYEDSAATSSKFIKFWKNQIKVLYPSSSEGASYGAYFLPSNYKRDISFELQATDGSVIQTITLVGVWPTSTGNLSLDYSSSDRVKFTQTFKCDDQTIEFASGGDSGFDPGSSVGESTLLESHSFNNLPQAGITNLSSLSTSDFNF